MQRGKNSIIYVSKVQVGQKAGPVYGVPEGVPYIKMFTSLSAVRLVF